MTPDQLADIPTEELHARMTMPHPAIGPMPVEIVIGCIRASAPFMETVYLHGSCWKFYLILKSIWPEAEPYTCGDHIISKIGNAYYDITGKVKKTPDYRRVTPAVVMKDRPHLWVCTLEHLANVEMLDPELLDWELDGSCNKSVAPTA